MKNINQYRERTHIRELDAVQEGNVETQKKSDNIGWICIKTAHNGRSLIKGHTLEIGIHIQVDHIS